MGVGKSVKERMLCLLERDVIQHVQQSDTIFEWSEHLHSSKKIKLATELVVFTALASKVKPDQS